MDLSKLMHHSPEDVHAPLKGQQTDIKPLNAPSELNSKAPDYSKLTTSEPSSIGLLDAPPPTNDPSESAIGSDFATGTGPSTVSNEIVGSDDSRKHSVDVVEGKPPKRSRTDSTPLDTSDDDNDVAYTIELEVKENLETDTVSASPALRSASRHPIQLDPATGPDLAIAKADADQNLELETEEIAENPGRSANEPDQEIGNISDLTVREPTGYGNRGYQSRTDVKENELLTGRLPRTQSPETDMVLDDLDASVLPPGTRISVQEIDRPRLMTIESRLARLAPLDHHRELSPAPLKPETVGGERNLPVYHRAFRYEHAATNIACFPHTEYTQCDAAPCRAGISSVDRGGNVFLVGEKADIVTTDGLYGSAKSNVCLRGGGEWYFEIEVLSPDVRIGLGRRESTCDGPVGFDIYSYGLQSKTGNKLHCGRPLDFMEPFGAGDVIGFHVNLPFDSRPSRIHRPRVPFVYENQLWLESRDYVPISDKDATDLPEGFKPLDDPETIKESFCRVYRNGKLVGPLAEPLLDFRPPHSTFEYWLRLPSTDNGTLGYYPMISVYRGGAARLISGPDFRYPPPPRARSLQDRYVEQTADNFAVDLTNEILFKRLDHILPRSTRRGVLHRPRTKKADSHHFA